MSGHQLKLYFGPESGDPPECRPEDLRWDGSRSVPAVVPEFGKRDRFSRWLLEYWVPFRLAAGEDPAADKTILGYFEAGRWAVRCAGDPCLGDLCEAWLLRVNDGLRTASYSRCERAGAKQRALSGETAAKHRRCLGTMLRELAWQGLVREMRTRRPAKRRRGKAAARTVQKPAYTVGQLRSIVAAAEKMPIAGLSGRASVALWRVLYGLAFYTGLRRETVLAAGWQHVEAVGGCDWLRIPASLTKDSESWDGALHPAVLDELGQLHGGERAGLLAPWPYEPDWWYRRHCAAVEAAGIVRERGRDLHGLRRAHTSELRALGFEADVRGLAALMNHSDPATTTQYYVQLGQVRAKYLPQLPAIW
jgi:integrase